MIQIPGLALVKIDLDYFDSHGQQWTAHSRAPTNDGGEDTTLAVPDQQPVQGARVSDIALAELRQRLGDPDLTIVDLRPLPAYNGWRLSGAARGGHIPGAVAFPSAWLDSVDAPEVERLLHEKGILHGREVVLYGDRLHDVQRLKAGLGEL